MSILPLASYVLPEQAVAELKVVQFLMAQSTGRHQLEAKAPAWIIECLRQSQVVLIGVPWGVASALVSLAVDSIALPLAYCHNKDRHLCVIPHLDHQAETRGAELDLVPITGAPRSAVAIPAEPRDERPAQGHRG